MSADPLGDRMKAYEAAEAERRFIPLLPVYARIDGRSFSRFTAGLDRPFDAAFTGAMVETASRLVKETHARIAYTQSDEISLVWLQERYGGEMFFDGRVQKMVSVLAGLATAFFHLACRPYPQLVERVETHAPHFDCRVFPLPNRAEAANAFLWRERDATKNAVSMAARAYYEPHELHGRRAAQMQEMLFAKGINFNDYPAFFKRGTFVRREVVTRPFTDEERAKIPERHRPGPGEQVERTAVVTLDMPPFGTVLNREAVIFDGALPETARAAAAG
ncbi:MAG TPA: tRNA(His) guanylyltransferase Thg1 family protein [Longimicrobium sp.]|nr:tRNA(His) guanylyltransferase Thg1 family protein [Longimicrobium sp.]